MVKKNILSYMKKDLPIYDIVLNDEDLKQGVGRISLVDQPAIGVNWIKLNKQEGLFFKAQKDKQLLYGPFLIPNMLIYRRDDINGEYYVRFSKEEIEKIATKFNEDLNNKNINFQHTDEMVDAFVAQNWIIEGEGDKSKGLGFDLPEGTWFGAVKVKDVDFWNEKVKGEEVRGFSVEILADLELKLKNKEESMEKMIKLGSATLNDGSTQIYWDGEFGMGTAIYLDAELTQPAPDETWILEDGTSVRTEGGVVVEIETPSKSEDMQVDTGVGQISMEEVNKLIDIRFTQLMEEITALKTQLEGQKEEFKKTIDEKFSTTPAVQSVAVKSEPKIEDKFKLMEEKVKAFAKIK